jgi:hypothetical protein
MVRKARVHKKGNRVILDLARGVTVTARRPSLIKLSNQAAMHAARSKLLASQVRAMQKVITAQVLGTAGATDTSAAQLALQQQLTDSRIAASNEGLLQTQVNQMIEMLKSTVQRSKQLQTRLKMKLTQLSNEYAAKERKFKLARQNVRSQKEIEALRTSLLRLNDIFSTSRASIINNARNEMSRLSQQYDESTKALLEKNMELDKAKQASRQTRILQAQLDRLRTPVASTISTPRRKARKRARRD